MKLPSNKTRKTRGFTLIEVMLYTVLLSFLISGFIRYAYDIHFSDLELTDKMNRGFIALIAVVLLATGTLAFSLATLSAAVSYADMSYRHDLRNQARLNAQACLDTVSLMAAKDYFLSGEVKLPEFGCTANVQNDFNGNVTVKVAATLFGISATDNEQIQI